MSRFRRRLMGLSALRQAKADDFVRVEYIENSNLAYINTGYKNGANSWRIDAVISLTTANKGGYIIGSRGSSRYFQTIEVTTNPYFETKAHQTTVANSDYTAELNKKYHLVGTPNSLTVSYDDIDEETQETVEKSFTITNSGGLYSNGYELTIFNLRQSISTQNAFYGRLYGLKLYNQSGTLIRDYIPMYQISTDTYGLWDRVNEEFYTSPNGVKFTGGQRVIADNNDNLYYYKNYLVIGTNKKCSIGLYPNQTDYWESKVYLAGSARNYFCGSWSANNSNMYGSQCYNGAIRIAYHSGFASYSPSGGYTNKTFTFKCTFNNEDQKMYFYFYDANGTLLNTQSIAKIGAASSRVFQLGQVNGSTYGANTNSRMYYFKYWRNQELVRDMIPVQSVETGEYGFFDKVNLKIYYSSGSADFTGA